MDITSQLIKTDYIFYSNPQVSTDTRIPELNMLTFMIFTNTT